MSNELFSVTGQVVLLSGASRGIGRAMAAGFAWHGAQVIITGRDRSTLMQTAEAISTADSQVRAIVCDVADPDAIQQCVSEVLDSCGRIDTLINVAGVNRRQPADAYSVEDYDFILDINLKGAFFMAQSAGRHMLGRHAGCIINIDSLNTYAPLKRVTPYAMSKGGMQMMTRSLALEWGSSGVRVNGIAPGFILTDLSERLWARPEMRDWAERNTPLGRLGSVDDLVGTALYLASPAAAFVTGQTLYVDGGMSAGIAWPIDESN